MTDQPDKPVTRAELARAISLLRSYSQYTSIMIAASLARDSAKVADALKEMQSITNNMIDEFGADIPRG